jgi:hypothetical protein
LLQTNATSENAAEKKCNTLKKNRHLFDAEAGVFPPFQKMQELSITSVSFKKCFDIWLFGGEF